MQERSFHIITFGCQMNVHDSQWLGRALTARGFAPAPLEEAQVVLVNTCSVREKPELKVMSTLGRIRQATGNSPRVLVGVTGCVAQQLGDALFRQRQVRLVAGSDGISGAPAAIERLLADPALRLSLLDFTAHYEEREAGSPLPRAATGHVNIMQGCDNFCAYCIVPFTRGRQKSRATAAVLDDCRALLAAGTRDITLLGQNVNAFGRDASGDGTAFHELLRRVDALPGLARLHYVTPHPKDMDAEDVAAFGELEHLCPRLHLPLQAGSDAVLKRMGRKYDAARFLDLVARLRAARPDVALSTDLIVGFPGESEDDFQATLDMMRECDFMASFSFCYSDRPGTRASRFLDKIPPEVQQDRLVRLQALQDELGTRWLAARVGQEAEILLEGRSPRDAAPDGSGESWQGRDIYGALVHVNLPPGDHLGRTVCVRIAHAHRHSLVGSLPGNAE
ncbi:MAG TPA: tRNA (N6-isopentenyl adenosine(37)-C2)-methylthiotransferase MiaB [Candidatus Desulfovibrio intestinavium]|uniref:tRNA-2-methylthio-N(6)-dimethylallyladenosine synthase n=1 Tax=Candidatus Desulfovibrio intestinavium TaxID=2838534 RepID=A0A9D2HMX2_9BACT|nr:tRNA (N6-isopentenyl adenosine(37)-C2)-methylthiotransferase MiaB [Candidatus Desulfovibrio intestinavium]